MRPSMRNVFEWLDLVRARPSMFVGDLGLRCLENLTHGYQTALYAHHLDEGVPQMTSHFSSWLRLKKRWSLSCGWAFAIEEHAKDAAWETFFELIDEYRKLLPTVRCYAILEQVPRRIDVVQYSPEPLHFLRLHHPEGVEDQHILCINGKDATTVEEARREAENRFQIEANDWITP
jgi:hypothetical protein